VRGLVALLGRETRDARWHVVSSLAIAVAVTFSVHAWALVTASDEDAALIGTRLVVPVLFALFAASTASDLVARDVATRRIDALAVLPVPVGRVWTAKALFLFAASLLFVAWLVAAECLAVAAFATPTALARMPAGLAAAVPSLLGGLALGAASLFFSTLLERGMAAALAALVVIVVVAASVQWAAIPAAPGAVTTIAYYAVPLLVGAAFVAASRAAFVRGPIHASSKWRLAYVGIGVLVAIAVPAGAAVALGVDGATRLAPGAGDASRRRAFLSPDGKWVAIEDSAAVASRTWIVRIDDGSCRPIADGETWFICGDAWLPGSVLRVRTSSFSVLDGPRHFRELVIEPTRLEVAEESWCQGETIYVRDAGASEQGLSRTTTPHGEHAVVAADGDVTLVSADGAPLRRLFPPKER